MNYFLFFSLLFFNSTQAFAQTNDLKDSLKNTNQATPIPSPDNNQFLSWKIKVKGIATGKEITVTGGPSELKDCWKNLPEKLTGFPQEEKAAIEMSFDFTNVLLIDTIEPSKIKKFPKKHFELLSNCEMFNFDYPEWTSPFYNNAVITAEISKSHSSPEGKGCLFLEGRDDNNDGYICSFNKQFKHIYSSNSSVITMLHSKAAQTWIFFYAYGKGYSSEAIQLLISEASPGGLMDNMNTIGYYSYEIPLDFYGWKQIAIRYSDLRPTTPWFVNDKNKVYGKEGDKILDPTELMNIQYTLVTKIHGDKASVCLDNLMILYNK